MHPVEEGERSLARIRLTGRPIMQQLAKRFSSLRRIRSFEVMVEEQQQQGMLSRRTLRYNRRWFANEHGGAIPEFHHFAQDLLRRSAGEGFPHVC